MYSLATLSMQHMSIHIAAVAGLSTTMRTGAATAVY